MDFLTSLFSNPATAPHNLGILAEAGQAIVGALLIPYYVATSPGRDMAEETHRLPQQPDHQVELVVADPQNPWD